MRETDYLTFPLTPLLNPVSSSKLKPIRAAKEADYLSLDRHLSESIPLTFIFLVLRPKLNIETFMYQLKNFVEVVLEFQVANKFGFKSLAEVAQFMDLTDSKPMLERKIEIMNFASKYIEK